MLLSFRTKECFGDIAVSFTDADLTLDLTDTWSCSTGREISRESMWIALAKEFNREIRRKLASPETKYTGSAVGFVRGSLGDVPPLRDSMCFGPNNDELFICMSNVGVVDKHFASAGSEGTSTNTLCVTEATAYCTNLAAPGIVFWCYTLHGKFHISILDITPPDRKEVFEAFTEDVFNIIKGF